MSEKYFILSLSELKQLCADTLPETRQLIAFDVLTRPYKEPLHLGSVLKDGVTGLVQVIDDLTNEKGRKK
jgi:hypothetical protein